MVLLPEEESENGSTKLECDYDINPSELYQAIEACQWDHIRNFSKTSYYDEEMKKASFKEQANTWVVRKEIGGKLRWRMLPLHAVMIFKCPYDVVEAIFLAAPNCVQSKDDRGMLPLHLAFRHAALDDVINLLITSCTSTIKVKDRKGRIPLECATGNQSSRKLLENYNLLVVASERQKVSEELKLEYDSKMDVLKKAYEQEIAALKKKTTNSEVEVKSARTACNAMLTRVTTMTNNEKKLHEHINDIKNQKLACDRNIATLEQKVSSIYHIYTNNKENNNSSNALHNCNDLMKGESLTFDQKVEFIKGNLHNAEDQYNGAIQFMAEKDEVIFSLEEKMEKTNNLYRAKEVELENLARQYNHVKLFVEKKKDETSTCKEVAEDLKKKCTNLMGTVQNLTNRNSNLEDELEELRRKAEHQATWLQKSTNLLDEVSNIIYEQKTWNIREGNGFQMKLIADKERKTVLDMITEMKEDLDKVLLRNSSSSSDPM